MSNTSAMFASLVARGTSEPIALGDSTIQLGAATVAVSWRTSSLGVRVVSNARAALNGSELAQGEARSLVQHDHLQIETDAWLVQIGGTKPMGLTTLLAEGGSMKLLGRRVLEARIADDPGMDPVSITLVRLLHASDDETLRARARYEVAQGLRPPHAGRTYAVGLDKVAILDAPSAVPPVYDLVLWGQRVRIALHVEALTCPRATWHPGFLDEALGTT